MNQDHKQQPNFTKERKQTDESLTVERGRTDESFANGRGATQEDTDEVILKNRNAADQARLQRRSDADFKRDGDKRPPARPSTLEKTKQSLSEEKDHALMKQRKSEDTAIKTERNEMDTALDYERGEKERLMSELVHQERIATDKNLLGERNVTDIASEKATVLLTVEHAAHLKTKTALTTRDEYAAIVSHDLRNPLGAILSATQILLEDFENSKTSADSKMLIELIQRNAETSLRLIRDILDAERIVEGKLHLHRTENQLDDLIHEVLESNSHVALEKNISLKTISKCTRKLFFDKDRVIQVLSNLIGNALKFTPKGGTVAVDLQETPMETKVSICDSGPGVPDNQKEKIFERYTQISNKDRRGIGLGLYISKTLIESHQGRIGVQSVEGAGSTFWFTLPAGALHTRELSS